MSKFQAQILAKKAVDYLKYKADIVSYPHNNNDVFYSQAGLVLDKNGFDDETLSSIKVMANAIKGMREATLSFADAISEAESKPEIGKQGVEKLKDMEAFSEKFKQLSGLDVIHFSDSEFDLPTLQQLGFSYNSGVQYDDHVFHTSGKPRNAFVDLLSPKVQMGINPTTLYIKTKMYDFMGSASEFNWQQGVLDQANLDQKVTHANYRTKSVGMKITPRSPWHKMQMDAHGIPDFAYANSIYFMEVKKDDLLAYGDPRADVFGFENCEKDQIDLSALSSFPGIGDKTYEATFAVNLFKGIMISIVTTEDNYERIVQEIIIPKNMYLYLQALERYYYAKADNVNSGGSIPSGRRFLAELQDLVTDLNNGIPVKITKGPVEMSNIKIVTTTNIQTYPAYQYYMSPMVSNVTATFEASPANFATEMMFTMSEIVVRNKNNLIEVVMPPFGNFQVTRKQFILSGAADTNPIVVASVAPSVASVEPSVASDTSDSV